MPLRSRVASRRCRIRRRSGAITTFAAALRDNVRARAGRAILILTSNLFKDKLKDYEGQRIGASRGYKNAKGEKVLFQPSRSFLRSLFPLLDLARVSLRIPVLLVS